MVEFNKILDKISHEDNIGHLFIVDIKFHDKNSKTLLFTKIYTPFEKNTKMEPFERSTLQLMTISQRNEEKKSIKSFPYNSKTHSTLKDIKFIPLYAEDLHFLIKRAGWLVTHIYDHFTPRKTKMVIEFNDKESASIKSFAVKKRGQIKVPLDSCQVNYLCLQNCLLKVSFMKSPKHFAFPRKMPKKFMINTR